MLEDVTLMVTMFLLEVLEAFNSIDDMVALDRRLVTLVPVSVGLKSNGPEEPKVSTMIILFG